MKLDGTRILVTGASGGIGMALAYALAERNASVILHGRNGLALLNLRKKLHCPERHHILAADLCVAEGREKLIRLVSELQGIDILINNAGTNQFAWLEDQSEQQILRQLELNIQVPILLSRALLPHMQNPGIIMNIGSSFGSIGYAGYSVYCASKYALRGFSEALSRELSDTNIKVLYLAPRATKTAINTDAVYAMNLELGNKSDSAEWVAQQAINVLEKEVERRWLGWPERFFVKLNALFPCIVDKALAKQHPVIARHANEAQKGMK